MSTKVKVYNRGVSIIAGIHPKRYSEVEKEKAEKLCKCYPTLDLIDDSAKQEDKPKKKSKKDKEE